MRLLLSTYRLGAPRGESEGSRIGTIRYLPRGVKKADYARRDFFDVWLPLLAPSRELLAWYRDADRSAADFFRRYLKEMSATDARQAIALLAELAKRTPISIGCYCEDGARCHRTMLERLIVAAAGGSHPGGHRRNARRDKGDG